MNTITVPGAQPRFSLLRTLPERAQPSLLRSLESFETSLYMLALARYPAALDA
jgi:hypothetical protein